MTTCWLQITTLNWHQPSNPPNTMLIIRNNFNIGVYNSEFNGESKYQFCFSIGLILLWQIANKHQNCVGGGVGGGAADHHQIARH
jgi:hypothetical protein